MDEQSSNMLVDENLVDPEKNEPETYRLPTRRTESYASYVPNRHQSSEYSETDPLLPGEKTKSSSKTCFRSPYATDQSGGGRSAFQYLPVFFVVFLFTVMYLTFLVYHLRPELNQDLAHNGVVSGRVFLQFFLTHLFLVLLVLSYFLCVLTSPGTIPNTVEWSLSNTDIGSSVLYETKKSGARRVCKWCCKFKPDRTHHCRTCGTCTLKMDHHCPWANNCIGWRNHKYFYLTVLYSVLLSLSIALMMYPTVKQVLNNSTTPFKEMALIMGVELLSVFLSMTLTCFFLFHTWLVSENFTTIEFCEKNSGSKSSVRGSIWSDGFCNNFKSVVGKNPLLWLLPYGNGVTFRRGEKGGGAYDENDQSSVVENSLFIKMARGTNQFDPEIGEESP